MLHNNHLLGRLEVMKLFKPFIFALLALSIVIRPVLAEGVMVHKSSDDNMVMQSQSSLVMGMDNQLSPMNQLMQKQAHLNNLASSHDCCDEGLHFCSHNCSDNHCLFMSSAPVFQSHNTSLITANEHATQAVTVTPHLISRNLAPELRPPLLNT